VPVQPTGWSIHTLQAAGALDAAPQDEELLAQEGVLGDEGGPPAHEVGEGAHRDALVGGLRRGDQALPQRASQGSPELGTTAEPVRQHRGLLSESGQRPRGTRGRRAVGV
jgi:hypothetical protein